MVLFNDTAGISRMNVSGSCATEFEKILITAELFFKPSYAGEYVRYIKLAINTCDLKNLAKGNYFMKMVLESLKLYSNWNFDCPQKIKFLYAYNFELSDKFLPVYLMPKTGYWCVSLFIKGKLPHKKIVPNVMTLKLHGVFVPN